jgi:hypothetical protein
MPTLLTAPAVEELFGERERREDSQAQKPRVSRFIPSALNLTTRTGYKIYHRLRISGHIDGRPPVELGGEI